MLGLAVVAVTGWYLHGHLISVLQPAGKVGAKERNLMAFCAALSVTVVVPVFALLWHIAWKYREDNAAHAKYTPDVDGNRLAETVWWLIPTVLIGIVSVITWRSSYAMDPFKPLTSTKPTLHIQVVAMDWKWLFIYPDQHIATVNEVAIPVDTPVDFEITSDAVMTSFWAPQLGGQMYAMPGMSTHLNLMASKSNNYGGVAANISGKGFADMKFTVRAMPQVGYNAWLRLVHNLYPAQLSTTTYAQLAKPSENVPVTYYSKVQPDLYDTIVMKYMMPIGDGTNTQTQEVNL